ncbi:unnamed protein product [Penicillium salamii]|uniref:Alpha/beta hydrolase fold-3 domain-containing protein n=1 Tax=Penicillium salamii TaxID=1612424 RepID=A0A9W4NHY7_9EURO|nr:unnamed protein product [Penicillium salamii]CAG8070305.1 unnamed protein product [Penicillium salamii]CAG8169894.1 unnamed protein product [Penicillium salamii]CAG8231131.1 unnamed protein product [Penicillium salamii]CAG8247002.1 unnamed protein product [Penicillium salamii]
MATTHHKLAGLDLIQTTYKKVNDHEIRTDILIPQKPHTGKRPVIIRFHGGGLVTGDSLFMDWWSHWVTDLAIESNAIMISPNYRLLPSVTSAQIYEDINDFWTWVHSSKFTDLLAAHSTPTEADLNRILTAGESAGGLLSISLALANTRLIRACTAAYPCVDLSAEAYSKPRDALPFGVDTPESVFDDALASFVDVESSAESERRLGFMLAGVQHGRFKDLYDAGVDGEVEARYPSVKLEKNKEVPAGGITIIHGKQDSVVPVEESEKFVVRAREVLKGKPGGDRISLTVKDGEHGFDADLRYEGWLKDSLQGAVTAWLE